MIKSRTVGGDNGYVVKLKIIFTFRCFSIALGEESYKNQINFDNLKKREAFKILYNRLELYGINGEYHAFDDLGDNTEEYNVHMKRAKEWVNKNYPYLAIKKK